MQFAFYLEELKKTREGPTYDENQVTFGCYFLTEFWESR